MSKKKSKISLLGAIGGLVILIAAVLFIVLPTLSAKNGDATYTGIQVIFGYKEKTLLGNIEVFKFSFVLLLVLILLVAGAALLVVGSVQNSKLFKLIGTVAGVVAGILLFFSVSFAIVPEILGVKVETSKVYELGVGAIVSGIVAILGGALGCYSFLKE
jgi:hypothetical protein